MICKPFRSQISRGDWTHFYLEKKNSNKCLLVHRQHTVTLWPDMHKKSFNFQTNRPINQPPPPPHPLHYFVITSYTTIFFPCLLLIFFLTWSKRLSIIGDDTRLFLIDKRTKRLLCICWELRDWGFRGCSG